MDTKPAPPKATDTLSPEMWEMMRSLLSSLNIRRKDSSANIFHVSDVLSILRVSVNVNVPAKTTRDSMLLMLYSLLERHKDISDEDNKKLNDVFKEKGVLNLIGTGLTFAELFDTVCSVIIEFEVQKSTTQKAAERVASLTLGKSSMSVIMTVPSNDCVDTITEFVASGCKASTEYLIERHVGSKLVTNCKYTSDRALSDSEVKDIYTVWKSGLRKHIEL